MVQLIYSAIYPCLVKSLGISSKELAEIGGFSDRFARDIIAGKKPFPQDIQEAVLNLQDDLDTMTDTLVAQIKDGAAAIFVFRDNETLRKHFSQWPARGKAAGGFVGPHYIAALTAYDLVKEDGIDVDILFFDQNTKKTATN